jgi:Anti-sigma-K factor rskA
VTREELTQSELELLSGIEYLLADEALWSHPAQGTEDAVVQLVHTEAGGDVTADHHLSQPASRRRRWLALAGAAALGAAAAGVVAVVVNRTSAPVPDQTMSMEGTALAPELSGSADFTAKPSGVEIEIHMPGLPRRDGGEYYELWMHNCSGTAWVPAGTFHDMNYVVAWAGVAATDYPVLKVTEEVVGGPDGAGQAPSDRVVAWGSLVHCSA